MAGTKGRRSPHIVRPGRNRHRILSSIGAAVLLGALAVSGVMPAGADGEDPPPEQTLAEAPPEGLPAPPETTAPPTTAAPPEDPPAPPETTAPPTPAPPADPPPPLEDPPELLRATSFDVEAVDGPVVADAALVIPLNNDTAEPGKDCPDDGLTYWHFVITPNNNHSAFVTFHLNLGDGIHDISTFIPGGNGQVDNVFVQVPTGYTLTSLDATNSTADITWDGTNPQPSKFNLSHTCSGSGGSLDVAKVVDGSGSPAAGAEFTIDVDCDDDAFDRTLTFDAAGVLTGGGPLPISDVPVGTECTVEETGDGGADEVTYSPDPATVTITTDGELVTVTVTNTFDEPEVGSLDVAKVVDGSGSPAAGAEFTIDVDCDDDAFDRTLTFDAAGVLTGGGPLPISDIPVGTECTVEETGDGGADEVTYSPDPATVTITTDGELVTVTVTNTFDEPEVGSLDVAKVVDGSGSPAAGAEFTIDVDCDDDAFDRTLTFDAAGVLTGGGPLPISDVPVGTECTVEETGDGGADEVTYSPDPATVTITTDGELVTVTVTNTFDEPEVGSISIVKETEGEVGEGTTFEVEVACDGLDPVLLTFTTPGDLGPKSVDDIPTGTDCTVEETQSSGATLVIYDPAGGTEQDPPTVTVGDAVQLVTVTNFFPGGAATGSVEVTKAVEGSPPEGATYDVRVFCTDGTDRALQFAADGGTQTVTGIQIPASCTVEETGQGGSSSVTYTPDDTTFSLTVQTPERDLTVTNIFDPQTITVVGGASAVRTVVRAPTGTLAFTGSPVADLLKVAVWLLVIGSLLCLVARRRAERASG